MTQIFLIFMLCATPVMSASPTYSSWMDDVAANTNANLQAPLHRNWMGRNGLYRTLKEDSLLAQNASLQSFVLQLESESQGLLKQVGDSILQNNCFAAKAINNSIIPETKPDSTIKEANEIFINAALSNIGDWQTSISLSGWDSLKTIAQRCPFEYGEMVYLSRIMLKIIGDTSEYFNECETDINDIPDKSAMFGNEDLVSSVLFPNPAQELINIETEMSLPATLTIYSALGEKLFSVQVTDSQSTFNIGFIKPQPVLFELRNETGQTFRGTLTIIE